MTVTQKVPLQSGTVTVTFTTATALVSGKTITVNFPASYFGSAVPTTTGSSIACNPACSTATIASITGAGNAGQFIVTTGVATAPAGTITLILAGVANAGPIMPSCTVVSVLTSNDIESVQTTGVPQLGGQVTGVTFAMTAAQRVANVAAAATTAVVTVGFQLATAYAAAGANQITITFPSNFFVSSTPTVVCTGGTGLTATVAYAGTSQFVLTTTTTGWDTTAKVCTFSNVATGSPTAAGTGCGFGVTVQSTSDLPSAAVSAGALGGQVTGVTFAMTAAQRAPNAAAAATTAVVTVGFQLATAYAAAGANQIIINFPSGFFLSSTPTVVCTGGTGITATVAYATSSTASVFVLTTTTTGWDTTAKVCTFSNVATGAPTAGAVSVTVSSTQDLPSTAVSSGALGGVVSNVAVTVAASDRVATVTNRAITVAFTIANQLATGATITIGYPTGFLSTTPTPTVTMATATGTTAAAPGSDSIVLTTATAALPAGSTVTITLCGATMGAGAALGSALAATVSTSQDRIACNNLAAITVGTVTAVSMTIAAAQRVASNTNQAAVFAFTTATTMTTGSASCPNSVTITLPSNFLASIAAVCGVTQAVTQAGLDASYAVTYTTGSITLTGTAGLTAGKQTVTISGLTFGAATNGVDTGVTVSTSADAVSAGVPSGPLSGFTVKSVTSSGCGVTCQTLVVSFSAYTSASSNPITITFSGNSVSAAGAKFNMGTSPTQTLVTPSVSSGNIVLTPSYSPFPAFTGTSMAITLVGVQLSGTGGNVAMQNVATGSGTATNQVYLAGLGSAVTAVSLNLPVRTPATTNAQAILSFTTTNALSNGQQVYIMFPSGFFVAPASTPICSYLNRNSPSYAYNVGGTLSSATCAGWTLSATANQNVPTVSSPGNYYTLTASSTVPAGAYTITLNGLTLSPTTVSSNPTGLIVATDADTCSTGVATGAIAPPGGANNGASSGQAILLSALAILGSMLLLLL